MRLQKSFILLFILLSKISYSQTAATEIFGKVIDASTKEPLPYVNIRLSGSLKATMTDPKGEYRIRSIEKVDTIYFSFIGYRPRAVPVKRGMMQELNVEMGSEELKLTEITVKAGKKHKRVIDTIANYVFYQVLRHKDENRLNNLEHYKYENYDRFEVSLINASQKFENFFIWKPFKFAFENKDTTETGSVYVPGVMKETVSDVYFRNHPRRQQKILVKAEKMEGIDNPTVYRLVDVEFRENDPYQDMYYFAQTYFNAPFSPIGLSIYYYYVTDTQKIEGRTSYKIHFVGKAKEDLALKGFAWIDSATWAIRSIQYRPNEKANLNFVNEYNAKVDYTLIDGKYWLKMREEMGSVASIFRKKNKLGLYVQKLTEKRNFQTDTEFPDSIFKGVEDRVLLDSARHRSDAFWDSVRFAPLSRTQARVIQIDDTIKKVPAFKFYRWLGVLLTTAFVDAGPLSIGRVLNFVSKNNVEGWRFRFGFETNPRFKQRGTPVNNFLRTVYFTTYAAYGLKDKDWKYLALMRINLPHKIDKWNSLEAYYRYDIRVPGQDPTLTLLTFDNVVTLISGKTFSKLMKVREFGMSNDRDWFRDFSTMTSLTEKTFYNVPGVSDFSHEENNVLVPIQKFSVTEFMINARYSYQTLFTAGNFYRYFYVSKYPDIFLRYTAGIGSIGSDNFNYHHLLLTVQQRLNSPIGYTNYVLKAGKVFGRAPYTAAYLTQGNLGVLLDKFNYNLLREFEFVSDQYVQLWVEHHFNGFFFNKIPVVNKLRLREVLIFKALMGSFSEKNRDVLSVPTDLSSPSHIPYIELGFGIENIGYLFRVDFLWRATYRNHGGQNWGVKFVLKPGF